MTLFSLLSSQGARALKTLFLFSALVFLIASAAEALAASRPSLAISPPQGDDLTYLYADIMDAGEIAARLQKSETLNFTYAPAKEMLAGLPATELSLMISVSGDEAPSFQMAWGLGGENKAFLERIAGGNASEDELGEFFGKISNSISVTGPEDGTPFYRIDPFGLYFSSNGELLIFANSSDGVKKSMLAAANSLRRFSPKAKSGGRNLILLGLGKELSAFFAQDIADLIGTVDGTSFPEKIAVETSVRLRPGGWELDLFTDAVKPFFGDDFWGRSTPKPYGSFVKAGGGRLIAALDGVPGTEQLLDGSYIGILSDILGVEYEWDADAAQTLIGRRAYDSLLAGIASSDRMNLAVTATDHGDLAGYITVSGTTGTDWKRAGDEISEALSAYGETRGDGTVKIKELPGNAWNHVFSVEAQGTQSDRPESITAAFGDNSGFAGFLRPDLLEKPFISDSKFYEALARDENALEVMYMDMKFLRKTLYAVRMKNPDRAYDRKLTAFITIPFLDFREIGAQTLSPEHFKFSFRTGWLDFEEREFIREIM
jgi:hypothetical protein